MRVDYTVTQVFAALSALNALSAVEGNRKAADTLLNVSAAFPDTALSSCGSIDYSALMQKPSYRDYTPSHDENGRHLTRNQRKAMFSNTIAYLKNLSQPLGGGIPIPYKTEVGTGGLIAKNDCSGKLSLLTAKHVGDGMNSFTNAQIINPTDRNKNIKLTLTAGSESKRSDIKLLDLPNSHEPVPVVTTGPGKIYPVTGTLKLNDIYPGMELCQAGMNPNTIRSDQGERCGEVLQANVSLPCAPEPDSYHNNGTPLYTSCTIYIGHRNDQSQPRPCDPGDSGAAVYHKESDGTVKIAGIVSAHKDINVPPLTRKHNACAVIHIDAAKNELGVSPYTVEDWMENNQKKLGLT